MHGWSGSGKAPQKSNATSSAASCCARWGHNDFSAKNQGGAAPKPPGIFVHE
eukprot:gene3406-4487_t